MPTNELAAVMDDAAAVDEALGRLLVERGRLDPAGLGRAQRVREASHDPLHLLLPKLGLVSEREVAETLGNCSICRWPARLTIPICRCRTSGSATTSSKRRAFCRWPIPLTA